MYTFTRYFYHSICGKENFYGKDAQKFNSVIDIKNFISSTYGSGYTIIEDPSSAFHITLLSNIVRIECYIEIV